MSSARGLILRQRFGRHMSLQNGLRRPRCMFAVTHPTGHLSAFAGQYRRQSTFADQQAHTYSPPKGPPRSLLRRALTTLAGATLCLSLGIYIGWKTLPHKPLLTTLLTPSLSDAQTLSAYTPEDAPSAAINTHILTHPLALALRSNPSFTESRPHMKIPPALRATNLTGGTLAGPGRLVVPPLQFVEQGGKSLVAIFYLGPQLCGHPGIVHGGLLATLLDEGLARCCFPALESGIGVTATLKVDYRKPVEAGGYYVLRASTEKVEGRKAWVTGWIEKLGDGGEGLVGVDGVDGEARPVQKLVEAEALFIEPRNAQVMKRIYQP